MPATPLHIGIPGLPALWRPDRVDITAVVLGATLVDIDFFLFVFRGGRIHGFLHTLLGATILAMVIVVELYILSPTNLKLKRWFRWDESSSVGSLISGALLGSWSHVFLDGLIYRDVRPLAPYSDGNALFLDPWGGNGSGGGDIIAGPEMLAVVYGVGAVTTVLLLMVWVWKYERSGDSSRGEREIAEEEKRNEGFPRGTGERKGIVEKGEEVKN